MTSLRYPASSGPASTTRRRWAQMVILVLTVANSAEATEFNALGKVSRQRRLLATIEGLETLAELALDGQYRKRWFRAT